MINKQNIRLIFGLKLKQLRQQKGLSFADLSKTSGLSVSYLNEIEKGKKYPKTDKIISLAGALGVSYDQLVSLKLSKKMAPIADLLNSGILESLPLEMFGLEIATLLDLISNAPTKINAFISTIIKIARNYEMSQENFYFAALRSYQEMHDNYFEDLEDAVDRFVENTGIEHTPTLDVDTLEKLLISEFGFTVDKQSISRYPELAPFRAITFPEQKKLYINPALTRMQVGFQLGKEIAYQAIRIEERPTLSNSFQVHSFEEVLNNFKASYFSVALLLNRKSLSRDLEKFFALPAWEEQTFLQLLDKYNATPEMFLHRLSNLLPTYFGIDSFFFLRFSDDLQAQADNFHITKELHLSRLHNPHRNDLNEHYCRRWASIEVLQELRDGHSQPGQLTARAQVSSYLDSRNEYLVIAIGRANTPTPATNVSVTLGIQVDTNSRKKIKWLNNAGISQREVNETCERCSLTDCSQRAAEPVFATMESRGKKILSQLEELKSLQ